MKRKVTAMFKYWWEKVVQYIRKHLALSQPWDHEQDLYFRIWLFQRGLHVDLDSGGPGKNNADKNTQVQL